MKAHAILSAVLSVFLVAAGANAAPKAAKGIAALKDLGPARPVREWALLIYLNADNNLEGSRCRLMNDMEYILRDDRLREKVEILVLFDRAKGYSKADGDWTGTRVYRIRPDRDADKINSELLADCGELNMGDPAVLEAFLTSAMKSFPARRYAMSFHGHGGGWAHFCVDHDAPGQPKGKDSLDLVEARGALKAALSAAGKERFDVVAFEMCLMGQLDVAVACKDLSEVVIFSEAVSFGPHVFKTLLTDGIAKYPLDTRRAARETIRKWPSHYGSWSDLKMVLTMSAVDCRKVDELVGALDALLAKLIPTLGRHWATLARTLFYAENYSGSKDLDSKQNAVASIDLIDVIKRMRANTPDFPAEREYQALLAAADRCVLARHCGYRRRRGHGLAIYAPPRPENVSPAYAQTPLARGSQWPKFLGLLHAAQLRSLVAPRFHSIRMLDPRGQVTDTVTPLMGHQCRFALDGANILFVNFGIGSRYKDLGHLIQFKTRITVPLTERQTKGKTLEELDLILPTYVDGRNIMAQELGGVLLQVASGDKAVYATVDTFEGPDTAVARGLYSDSSVGKDVKIDIIFDVNRWVPLQVIAHVASTPGGPTARASIMPRRDGVFRPHIDLVTWLGATHTITHGEIKWGDGLRLIMNVVPPGEQALFLEAQAVSGLPAVQRVPFKVRANPDLDRYLQSPRRVTAKDLVGRWEMHTLVTDATTKRQEFRLTNTRFEFARDPRDAAKVTYRMTIDGKHTEGPAHLETLGLPLLSLYAKGARGGLTRTALFVPFNDPAGGKPGIRLRDMASRSVYRLVKVSPAVTLVGRWKSKTGMVFQFDKTRYRMSIGGQESDSGSYTAEDGKLTIKSDNGQTMTPGFTLEGDTLTIIDGANKTVLQRAAEGKKVTPAKD